jgi:hypothetical protein
MTQDQPTPHTLWQQANERHPDDWEARRVLYRSLMIEHGHLVVNVPDLPTRARPTV